MFQASSSPGHDAQACVEEALRRSPSAEHIRRAAPELQLACRAGDAGGCSALGVLAELGLGRSPSRTVARGLYARACEGGNARGCVNLGKLDLASDPALHGERASRMFAAACDAGEASGCAALGQLRASGQTVARDVTAAAGLFGKACAKGSVVACYELAELHRTVDGVNSRRPVEAMDRMRMVELYVKACVAGHAPACARLETPPTTRPSKPVIATR